MARYVTNPNFARQLARSRGVRAVVERPTRAGLAEAQRIAPVGWGDYREGLDAGVALVDGAWTGRIVATDWASHWVEWGSINNPPYAVLRRAVAGVGLRFAPR